MNLITSFAHKLHENGLTWTVSRVIREFKSPSFAFTQFLIRRLKYFQMNFFNIFSDQSLDDSEPLNAVYDLSFSPITFDFAYFLIGCELFAKTLNKQEFFVWIVRKELSAPTEKAYNAVISKDSVEWRLQNIILPLISLHPKCSGFAIVPSFSNITLRLNSQPTYPEFIDINYRPVFNYLDIYAMAKSHSFDGLCASAQGLHYVRTWREANNLKSNIVTITIRQYGYDSTRNSNISEWIKFAEYLVSAGYTPVFIPDTDVSFESPVSFHGYLVFNEACWNLGLRMALYEESFLNFFVSNGPATLAQLNKKVHYITMNMVVSGSLNATEDTFLKRGIDIGLRRFSFATHLQFLSWKVDSFENILDEFNTFVQEFGK